MINFVVICARLIENFTIQIYNPEEILFSRREDDFLALFLSRGFAEFTFDNGDGVTIVR